MLSIIKNKEDERIFKKNGVEKIAEKTKDSK